MCCWKAVVKKMKDERGLTLVELMLSLVMLEIIILAAMIGLQFAYTTLMSSEDFNMSTYAVQAEVESDLSMARVISDTSVVISNVSGSSVTVVPDNPKSESIQFTWDGGAVKDFTTEGVRVIRKTEGGSYLDEHIIIYIPTGNTNH